jgi:hypothetical protein
MIYEINGVTHSEMSCRKFIENEFPFQIKNFNPLACSMTISEFEQSSGCSQKYEIHYSLLRSMEYYLAKLVVVDPNGTWQWFDGQPHFKTENEYIMFKLFMS